MPSDDLCEGCPPIGYPTDETRCLRCPRRGADADREAAARLATPPGDAVKVVARGPAWIHIKTGGVYDEVGRGRMQTAEPLPDMADVVIYRSRKDGSLWCRPVAEFEDGRFGVHPFPMAPSTPERAHGEQMREAAAKRIELWGKFGSDKDAAIAAHLAECVRELPIPPAEERPAIPCPDCNGDGDSRLGFATPCQACDGSGVLVP